jgi:ABC-2 type transport system permease protein
VRALSAEFVKFFTTRLWMWLMLLVAALTGLLVALITANAPPDFEGDAGRNVAQYTTALAPIAYVVAATIGIVGITGEFRHQTITPTLLGVPQRAVVVLAKLFVYLLFGGALGALFVLVLGGISQPVLSSKGIDISLSDDPVAQCLLGTVLVTALFGVFGVGIGTLLRNQVAAVVTTILYLFVVENILMVIPHVQGAYPYLPGGAAKAVLDPESPVPDSVHLLTSGQGALVLAAWALGLAVVGSVLSLGRDIT